VIFSGSIAMKTSIHRHFKISHHYHSQASHHRHSREGGNP
jgi:hypothetical protein